MKLGSHHRVEFVAYSGSSDDYAELRHELALAQELPLLDIVTRLGRTRRRNRADFVKYDRCLWHVHGSGKLRLLTPGHVLVEQAQVRIETVVRRLSPTRAQGFGHRLERLGRMELHEERFSEGFGSEDPIDLQDKRLHALRGVCEYSRRVFIGPAHSRVDGDVWHEDGRRILLGQLCDQLLKNPAVLCCRNEPKRYDLVHLSLRLLCYSQRRVRASLKLL